MNFILIEKFLLTIDEFNCLETFFHLLNLNKFFSTFNKFLVGTKLDLLIINKLNLVILIKY